MHVILLMLFIGSLASSVMYPNINTLLVFGSSLSALWCHYMIRSAMTNRNPALIVFIVFTTSLMAYSAVTFLGSRAVLYRNLRQKNYSLDWLFNENFHLIISYAEQIVCCHNLWAILFRNSNWDVYWFQWPMSIFIHFLTSLAANMCVALNTAPEWLLSYLSCKSKISRI